MHHSGNKYHRQVKPLEDYKLPHIDIYRVLDAFEVKNPGIQHAVKKLLCAGLRNKGSLEQDLKESQDAITEAIKIEVYSKNTETLREDEILTIFEEDIEEEKVYSIEQFKIGGEKIEINWDTKNIKVIEKFSKATDPGSVD